MAQNDFTNEIIVFGGIGLAIWYAYEQGWLNSFFQTAPLVTAPTTAPVTTTTAPPVTTSAPPVTTTAPPVTTTTAPTPQPIPTIAYNSADQPWALQMAQLSSVNVLDMDQWNYYFNQLANGTWSGILSPISGSQVNAMLRALTTLGKNRASTMTLPQWYWLVTVGGGGLSGLGNYFGIPMEAIHGGF